MSEEAIHRAVRRTRKARPLGPDARCWKCGCADPTVLHWHRKKIWCYECSNLERGKSGMEKHHLLGKANDETTVTVPGNLHLPLTDAQTDWPREVRYNTDRDPLLWLAGLCRSLHDIGEVIVGWLQCIAQFLEQLSRALHDAHGPRWWETLGVGPLWGGSVA
jgi:hypothetical protein